MISHRRNFSVPKLSSWFCIYKDLLPELLFGFTGTYLLWCCSVLLGCSPSLTAVLHVMFNPSDMGKVHTLISVPPGQ